MNVGRPVPRTRRSRGHIKKLKSGSLRDKIYAGHDKLLRKPLYPRFADQDIAAVEDVLAALREVDPGDRTTITVVRDGDRPELTVTVGETHKVTAMSRRNSHA